MAKFTTGNPLLDVAVGKRSITAVAAVAAGPKRKYFCFAMASMIGRIIHSNRMYMRQNMHWMDGDALERATTLPLIRDWIPTDPVFMLNAAFYREISRHIRNESVFITDMNFDDSHRFRTWLNRQESRGKISPLPVGFYDLQTILTACDFAASTLSFEGDPSNPLNRTKHCVRLATAALRYRFENWLPAHEENVEIIRPPLAVLSDKHPRRRRAALESKPQILTFNPESIDDG